MSLYVISMITKNSKSFYQLEKFNLHGVIHGFSTKRFGNMSYKWGEKRDVDKNRQNFAKTAGLNPKNVVQMSLNHGTKVEVVDEKVAGDLTSLNKILIDTDAMVTNTRGIVLWLLTADCSPYLFYDPKKKVTGLAHVGWRGAVGKLPIMVVDLMRVKFNSALKDIIIGVGPSIKRCCYFKDKPVVQEELPEWHDYISFPLGNKVQIDLDGFSINQLIKIGIKKENIDCADFCTRDRSDEMFCYQLEQEGKTKPGRFASVIQMI